MHVALFQVLPLPIMSKGFTLKNPSLRVLRDTQAKQVCQVFIDIYGVACYAFQFAGEINSFMYTWITKKDLLYSTGNSTQYSVKTYIGKKT